MSDTKKLRILFYRTPWQAKLKYWVNWLISIRTLSPWSHCEVWTADEFGMFYEEGIFLDGTKLFAIHGLCYTATMRGDDNGTVCRDAGGVLDHPENWDYFEIEVDTMA